MCLLCCSAKREAAVTELDYQAKLLELERLLNDPGVDMEPSRVWSLLDEVAQYDEGVAS